MQAATILRVTLYELAPSEPDTHLESLPRALAIHRASGEVIESETAQSDDAAEALARGWHADETHGPIEETRYAWRTFAGDEHEVTDD